jgi:acetyl-CoA carboxylase biotin carboxyl carrier protein
MARHDLNEIDLRDGAARVRLLRGGSPIVAPGGYAPMPSAPPTLAAPQAQPQPAKEAAKPAAPARNLLEIKSPSVGTFYAAREPGAAPLVRIGDRVSPSTVVGLVEAMKTYNEITADCSGVIVEQLAQNEQPIEFDTVLFRVDPGA